MAINKENFQKVITAIEENGIAHFNMAAFLGVKNHDVYQYDEEQEPMFAHEYKVRRYEIGNEIGPTGTTMFNCDTVGCIAGFAVAVQNNWKLPSWVNETNTYFSNYSAFVRNFESNACEYLGLSNTEGQNLFYNGNSSIWKWLVYNTKEYTNLKIRNENYDDTDTPWNDEFIADDEWNNEMWFVDFSTIDWKTACDVLTRIMNEELVLDNGDGEPGFGPNYKGEII